jgi:hypothetical protein
MWTWWDAKAFNHRQEVQRVDAMGDSHENDFTAHNVRRAVVYARRDLVLAHSLLSSLNQQIRAVKLLLFAILMTLGVIAYRL